MSEQQPAAAPEPASAVESVAIVTHGHTAGITTGASPSTPISETASDGAEGASRAPIFEAHGALIREAAALVRGEMSPDVEQYRVSAPLRSRLRDTEDRQRLMGARIRDAADKLATLLRDSLAAHEETKRALESAYARGFSDAREAAARIVQPEPGETEERECGVVAAAIRKLAPILAVALLLTACCIHTGRPAKPGTLRAYREHRAACRQAYEIGWCVTGCKRQPMKCRPHIQLCIGCSGIGVVAPTVGSGGGR